MSSSTAKVSISPPTPLFRDPAVYLWKLAVKVAAAGGCTFTGECAANLKERISAGLKDHKVGCYEFRDRRSEAEGNITRLVQLMITEERSRQPGSQTLQEAGLFSALYGCRLCPGLWPLC